MLEGAKRPSPPERGRIPSMQPGSTDEAAFRGWVAKLLGEPEGLASEEYTVSHNSKYWRSTGGSVTRTAMCVSGTLPSHWSDARTRLFAIKSCKAPTVKMR